MPAQPNAARTEQEQFERIPTRLFTDADDASRTLAKEIAALIRQKESAGQRAVLGLATGSTPVRLYRELIRLHREEGLSFRNILTFNLDEYYGLAGDHPESYRRFMQEQLFEHLDIPAASTHVPDGTVDRGEVFDSCRRYEEAIAAAGGLDIQVLGIGRTGHIGFNEPGSTRDSRTRLITLDALTRRDAARDFLGEANVPRHAITMGVGTILEARRVVLLAWGEAKAAILGKTIEEPPTDQIPASFLQLHSNAAVYLDPPAAGILTRIQHPWRVGPVDWTPRLVRKAVVWLAGQVKKPILRLVDSDYTEQALGDLITDHGPAYNLNIRIFNEIQHTITGWPAGKPGADDTHRPERVLPFPKRVLLLAPEPQVDILCLGGTLHRLIDQGHAVTVAYLTSGNLAVPDDEALLATDLVLDLDRLAPESSPAQVSFARQVRDEIQRKGLFGLDTTAIRQLKSIIRRGEARASLKTLGLPEESVRFLDLPFYEKGRYRRFDPTEADTAAVAALLDEIQPHQIFVTGSQADPTSLEAITFGIFDQTWRSRAGATWPAECRVWLYRGPQREWDVHDIDMAVPLSPDEFRRKQLAIAQHQSQRQQTTAAESAGATAVLNQKTAASYDRLGLAEYEALEALTRYA